MKRKILLTLMIGWDFSLHLFELLGIKKYHLLWPDFSTRLGYTIFWTIFWGLAFLIILSLTLVKGGQNE